MTNPSKSYFAEHTHQELEEEIQAVYLENNMPWIIGYSGGKDSTATLQLIWNALTKLPRAQLNKPFYILSSDTLVETPVIVGHIITNIQLMKIAIEKHNLPAEAFIVKPKVHDSFWVNLLGRGYPAPTTHFRWCTDRLKIKPANTFIEERLREYGNVAIILGARKDESITRQQVMELKRRQIPGSKLTHHSTLPKAYCYTPIAEFSLKDVWDYLLQNPSPWGANNRDLVTLYRNAQDGECPLVVDTSTPSCGNSRFGCWVCTVVKSDHSMEALIDSGEEWLEPLLEFRDMLAETQFNKKEYRNYKRRSGKIQEKMIREKTENAERQKTHTGEVVRGPYWLQYRKQFLERLLSIQQKIRLTNHDPHFSLITDEELLEIRRIWRVEEVEDPDWEDSLPKIYERVTGQSLFFTKDDLGEFSLLEEKILRTICQEEQFPTALVKKLLVEEQKALGMNRRGSIFKNLNRVLNEDWRSEKEFLGDLSPHRQTSRTVAPGEAKGS